MSHEWHMKRCKCSAHVLIEMRNSNLACLASSNGRLWSEWPLEPAIDAFEVIAACHGSLGPRCSAAYTGLCHPVHRAGAVYLWEVLYENRNNISAQS